MPLQPGVGAEWLGDTSLTAQVNEGVASRQLPGLSWPVFRFEKRAIGADILSIDCERIVTGVTLARTYMARAAETRNS